MFWVHGLKEGDEVRLTSESIVLDGDTYVRGNVFKIVRECWPDEWMIFSHIGENHKITNEWLMNHFAKVEKPQPVPIPKTLRDWFEKTKEYVSG